MKKSWILRGAKFALFVLAGILIFGWIITGLWNSLMPPIFGLGPITFWQALGLLLLSKILFGGFGPRGRGMGRRGHRMTPEERARFREGVRNRCGHGSAPVAETKI